MAPFPKPNWPNRVCYLADWLCVQGQWPLRDGHVLLNGWFVRFGNVSTIELGCVAVDQDGIMPPREVQRLMRGILEASREARGKC